MKRSRRRPKHGQSAHVECYDESDDEPMPTGTKVPTIYQNTVVDFTHSGVRARTTQPKSFTSPQKSRPARAAPPVWLDDIQPISFQLDPAVYDDSRLRDYGLMDPEVSSVWDAEYGEHVAPRNRTASVCSKLLHHYTTSINFYIPIQDHPTREWVRYSRGMVLDEMIRLEGRGLHSGMPCPRCGVVTNPTFRCEDCIGGELYCSQCMISMHRQSPFHNIKVRRFHCFIFAM